MKKDLPPLINIALKDLQIKYSESNYTTNAGLVLRLLARIIPADALIKMLVHKK